MVGGSLRVLQLLPPLKLVAMCIIIVGFGQDVDNKYRCPDHLSRTYLKAFKDKCYRFEKRTMYWTSARFMCSRENGTLIQIMNQETQNWVVNTLNALQWSTNVPSEKGLNPSANKRSTEKDVESLSQ
jgi:phage terminase small subunit